MKLALVYPPTCDPTAPYLAVPMLTGFLRARGVEVLPIDANLEAFDRLLSEAGLSRVGERVEARLAELDARATLDHEERLEYLALQQARSDADAAPRGITRAKAVLRCPTRFFEPTEYDSAVLTIEAALRAVSAAYHPLHLDFTAYRTPFGLTSLAEIERAAGPDTDPFHDYVAEELIPRLEREQVDVVGLSVCFPGQLQPAYAFALQLKRALPGLHVTAGGPGITQLLIRLQGRRLERALGPFDSAVVYEGEHSLLRLLECLDAGGSLRDVPNVVTRDPLLGARSVPGHGMVDLKALPAPDFAGLPLDRYLSPHLTLPYDPTRGCYWGKCTFCHYGLAEVGTAKYRERDVATAVEHLGALAQRFGTRHFYFSQDSVAPKTLLKLAEAIGRAGLDLRWATDMKPEKYLTPERARTLREGGAVACALGVESASPRVLELIDKGAPIETVSNVIDHLSNVGIAAEAMCFTDFPTETGEEALATLRFLSEKQSGVGVYIVGEFGLTHGSLVAQRPERFGIGEVWQIEGDELGLGLFFQPAVPWKTDEERAEVESALAELSSGWVLRTYPWAGAVSTAHTVLYYERFGADVFRRLAREGQPGQIWGGRALRATASFALEDVAAAAADDAALWQELVVERRQVSRELYRELAAELGRLRPAPAVVHYAPGREPVAERRRKPGRGRRPSHRSNALRQS